MAPSMRRSFLKSHAEDKLLRHIWSVIATIVVVASGNTSFAENAGDPKAVKSEDGKYLDKEGNPTFNVSALMAPSTGTHIRVTGAITRNATFVMAPMGWDRPTHRH
jgi:hypothetical protein